jgi:hypothetical protein
VKIMTEKELLAVACEQFLGKNVQDIKNVVLQTLEGHLRSILGEALPSLSKPGTRTSSGLGRGTAPLMFKLKCFPGI